MGHRDEAIAAECCGAVGRLLVSDAAGDGSVARDAVQLVADLVKLRRCVIRPLSLYLIFLAYLAYFWLLYGHKSIASLHITAPNLENADCT
jgi:hypothetical protein